MDKVLATLREQASIIVVDAPALLPVATARVLAAKSDAVVLLAQWRKTSDSVVRGALRLLPAEYVHVAGVALNSVNVREVNKYAKADAHSFPLRLAKQHA
jgi:Mrp family chromosome partitioning ATPase